MIASNYNGTPAYICWECGMANCTANHAPSVLAATSATWGHDHIVRLLPEFKPKVRNKKGDRVYVQESLKPFPFMRSYRVIGKPSGHLWIKRATKARNRTRNRNWTIVKGSYSD